MRFLEIYDKKKLNKEDRRAVFSYVSNSAMFNSSQKLSNNALLFSLKNYEIAFGALVLSLVSIFIQILPDYKVLIILIGLNFFIIILIRIHTLEVQLRLANDRVDKIIGGNMLDNREIGEFHFAYAKK